MITFKTLAESDHPHFAQSLFEEAFPEQERPPFSSLRHRDAGKFHFLVAENGDEPVGILTYWTFEDLVYIEHFAIDEDLCWVNDVAIDRNDGFLSDDFVDVGLNEVAVHKSFGEWS